MQTFSNKEGRSRNRMYLVVAIRSLLHPPTPIAKELKAVDLLPPHSLIHFVCFDSRSHLPSLGYGGLKGILYSLQKQQAFLFSDSFDTNKL